MEQDSHGLRHGKRWRYRGRLGPRWGSQEQEGVGVLYEEEEGSNDFLVDGYISQQLEKNKQREEEEEREKDWKEQFGMGYSEIPSKKCLNLKDLKDFKEGEIFKKKKQKNTFLNYKNKIKFL